MRSKSNVNYKYLFVIFMSVFSIVMLVLNLYLRYEITVQRKQMTSNTTQPSEILVQTYYKDQSSLKLYIAADQDEDMDALIKKVTLKAKKYISNTDLERFSIYIYDKNQELEIGCALAKDYNPDWCRFDNYYVVESGKYNIMYFITSEKVGHWDYQEINEFYVRKVDRNTW